MKELSVEEKAKAYDEAIRKLRVMIPNWERLSYNGKTFLQDLIYVFPELAESEGEKVRKELIKHLKEGAEGYEPSGGSSDYQRWLAWLEKQGEKKPEENKGNLGGISSNWNEEDEQHIDSLLKRLDSLYRNTFGCTKFAISEDRDWLKSLKDRVQPKPKQEWSKEDDGVLLESISVLQNNGHWVLADKLKSLRPQKCLIPSEEEIEKAAQEWDSKANFNPFYMTMEGNKPTGVKQDITTHEESFKAGVNWILKSLKGRVQPKQEWSDEDETVLNNLIYALANDRIGNNRDEYVAWLKSLRPQNHWKPSDEQMGCLSDAIEHYNSLGYPASKLKELLDDLKKLREE